MAILPTDPLYSKLLVTSLKPEHSELMESIASIVAMLSVENVYYNPRDKEKEVSKKRKWFVNHESDHITLLNIFNSFYGLLKSKSKREAINFAKDHFINDKSLLKAVQI